MTPIVPCLWFDDEAEAAAALYTQALGGTIHAVTRVQVENPSGKPKGSVLTAEFEAGGQRFTALNGGPQFKPNANISFFVFVKSPDEATRVWTALEPGGAAMMPLDAYPWSPRYGWIQDRFGVSWQVMTEPAYDGATIVPCFMFSGPVHGRAQDAMRFWCGVFPDAKVEQVETYAKDEGVEGGVKHGRFRLAGQRFAAMDSHVSHQGTFTEGLSFQVRCADQRELDHFWSKLVDGGAESQCGWLKDRFGVSWQIIPANLGALLKSERAVQAMLGMKKLDIAALERA